MDKIRVYELARDIGITSPQTIRLLKDKLQIRVKSASSTIEEDIDIKLKRLIRLEGARPAGESGRELRRRRGSHGRRRENRGSVAGRAVGSGCTWGCRRRALGRAAGKREAASQSDFCPR